MFHRVSKVRDIITEMKITKILLLSGAILVLSISILPFSAASSPQQDLCSINVSLQPPTLYYPSLPSSGAGFGEVVSITYSPDLVNSSFQLQVLQRK